MNDKKMKLIDFSQGIKSTEIQHNFDVLQHQINKERSTVAGPGLSFGFDFSLKDFVLAISDGNLIDKDGEEVSVEAEVIRIEKPILIEKNETLIVDEFNRVTLSEVPYATSRDTISQESEREFMGLSAFKTGTEDAVSVVSIDGTTLNLKASYGQLQGTSVDVSYFYTYKRRDIIFIDDKYKIQYRQGITSPSPSIPVVSEEEYSYILGYIEVNGHSIQAETGKTYAKASIIKEFKAIRNVYTDADNKLYLCGTPFDSLKVIHLVEPSNPEENTFWYDLATNKLKIWRATDSYTFSNKYTVETSDPNAKFVFSTDVPYLYNGKQLSVYVNGTLLHSAQYEEGRDLTDSQKDEEYVFSSSFEVLASLKRGDIVSYRIERTDGYQEWVSINDSSYIPIEERLMWTPEIIENEIIDKKHNKQLFLFHATKEQNMRYTPGKNCLEILINQIPLHKDQYREITLYDALAGSNASDILSKLVKYYGYEEDIDINSLSEEYENFGIGFELDAPLDKNSYVEVRVTQHVNATSVAKRFQRTATFVEEENTVYREYIAQEDGSVTKNTQVFNTASKFKYGENQLEVYVNGKRLASKIEFVEIPESSDLKGSNCSSFEVVPSALRLLNNDVVSYKVTSNVYSYDHVEALLKDFDTEIEDCKQVVSEAQKVVTETNADVEKKITIVDQQITSLREITNNMEDHYVGKEEVINKKNIDSEIVNGVMNNNFYETILVTAEREYDISDICSVKDFTLLFNTNDSNGNKILKRGNDGNSDYSIDRDGDRTMLRLLSTSIAEGHILYLTGIRFGI